MDLKNKSVVIFFVLLTMMDSYNCKSRRSVALGTGVVSSGASWKIDRKGYQIELVMKPTENEKEIEIYTNVYNPSKCNSGQWADKAEFYRTNHYKGFITIPKGTQHITNVTELLEKVKEEARAMEANLVCGGKIDKIDEIEEGSGGIISSTYLFYGSALHSVSTTSMPSFIAMLLPIIISPFLVN